MIEPIQGQVVRVSNYSGAADNPTGGFRDDTGTLVDPLTVNLSTTAPDGTPTDYSLAQLTREATGLYFTYVDTTDQPGVWAYVWSSSEPQTYEPGSFPVESAADQRGRHRHHPDADQRRGVDDRLRPDHRYSTRCCSRTA